MTAAVHGDDFRMQMRLEVVPQNGAAEKVVQAVSWPAEQTAVIVCDVWDLHHGLNAVRRLEEFAPRMNDFLQQARKQGAIIIHAPSDCMPAYAEHPARQRAIAAPQAKNKPQGIEHWCSRIAKEESAVYPLDQSDGGEDDDPQEHAEWAAKLKAQGRNPAMPWKTQSKLIEIDAERDYLSDRGDEVWNVLEARGIKNVMLVGVHLNMCVLGRPFGLRQMVRNGKNAVLVRDLTDCMYNPQRWPHVDHFTGNDLMVAHVERYVCPTITSDQLLGDKPFRSTLDTRKRAQAVTSQRTPEKDWTPIVLPSETEQQPGVVWYRCVVRVPKQQAQSLALRFNGVDGAEIWWNGQPVILRSGSLTTPATYPIPSDAIVADDYNLLVLRVKQRASKTPFQTPHLLLSNSKSYSLKGSWQYRLGDAPSWSNIPLPAKFGGATDMTFELP